MSVNLVRSLERIAALVDWMESRECSGCGKIATNAVARSCTKATCPVIFAQKPRNPLSNRSNTDD